MTSTKKPKKSLPKVVKEKIEKFSRTLKKTTEEPTVPDIDSFSLDKANLALQLRLKNKTDEKLFDVPLFEYKHVEQTKIQYSSFYAPYDFILRQVGSLRKSDKLKIYKITITANCEYEKFAIRQVLTILKTIWADMSGRSMSSEHNLQNYYDFAQVQKNMVVVSFPQGISFTNSLSINLGYLMPETTVEIMIWYNDESEK